MWENSKEPRLERIVPNTIGLCMSASGYQDWRHVWGDPREFTIQSGTKEGVEYVPPVEVGVQFRMQIKLTILEI